MEVDAPEPEPMRAPEPVALTPESEPEPVSRRAKAKQNGGVTSLFDAPISPRKARAARPAWDRKYEDEDEDEEYEDDEYDEEYEEDEEDELSEEEKEHSKAMEMNSWKARLLRWLVDLPTPARRLSYPGLVAFYWTGGAPQSYIVGNISATGVYLVTKERWTPGTVIMMTLQMTDSEDEDKQDSITVMSQVVRWGPDGVGLQFVPPEVKGSNGEAAPGMGADKKALEVFLRRVKPAKV